jgi:hypothetical protein
MKRNAEIVFRALMLGIPVKLGINTLELNEETGLIGAVIDKDVYIMPDGPMSLNTFIKKCEELPETEIVGLAADCAMTAMKRRPKYKPRVEIGNLKGQTLQ